MDLNQVLSIPQRLLDGLLSVPVRWKIIGIGLLPVLILGISLNYWVTTGLSDWLSYILTDMRVSAAMQAGSRSVIFVTILGAVLSILLSLLLVTLLTRPLMNLRETAEEVAAGKYDTRAKVWAADEIGSLAESVNQMIDNFVRIQRDLYRSNQQLAALNRISQAADREDEIHDVLYIALTSLLSLLDLETGWVYLYDPELDKHHLASWSGVSPEQEISLLSHPDPGLCTCQEAMVAGELGDQVTIRRCSRLGQGESASHPKHVTIPITDHEVYFGIINLAFPQGRVLDADKIELLSSIGAQISEIVANAWLQIKLREKEAARQLLLENLVTAQESERKRLARELHDQTGQTLTNLLIRLKTIQNKSSEPEVQNSLGEILEHVAASIDQIRDLSYSLRPPALEEFGLGAAVKELAAELQTQTSLEISCCCDVGNSLPDEVAMVLYRIVQEGLTNVIRHAGAETVQIQIDQQAARLYLKIEDDGRGFDPAQMAVRTGERHLGLISMSERAELIGGRLQVSSAPGVGTTLEVIVPMPQWSDHEYT